MKTLLLLIFALFFSGKVKSDETTFNVTDDNPFHYEDENLKRFYLRNRVDFIPVLSRETTWPNITNYPDICPASKFFITRQSMIQF